MSIEELSFFLLLRKKLFVKVMLTDHEADVLLMFFALSGVSCAIIFLVICSISSNFKSGSISNV